MNKITVLEKIIEAGITKEELIEIIDPNFDELLHSSSFSFEKMVLFLKFLKLIDFDFSGLYWEEIDYKYLEFLDLVKTITKG